MQLKPCNGQLRELPDSETRELAKQGFWFMEKPAIVVPHLVVTVYIPLLSLYLHKLFSRYMLNTSVSWSRQDQRPWILTADLSVLFCLFP